MNAHDAAIDGTLGEIARAAAYFFDDWWVIGSAAAFVAGAAIENIADIDLLVSERDFQAALGFWRVEEFEGASPSDQFRSKLFARIVHFPAPVELMAGFEIRVADEWRPVRPTTRERRGGVFIPSVAEQIDLLRAIARPKDAARINALCALE